MQTLNDLLWAIDDLDLTKLHFAACFVGALLCIWFMQLMTATKLSVPGDGIVSYHARRIGLAVLALSLCWAMSYSSTNGWKPWVPDVVIIMAVDALLIVNLVVGYRTLRSRHAPHWHAR